MNPTAFCSIRAAHPNPIVEFRWPVGKEVPSDVRRLTVSEFHLAAQLAAKCVRDVRGTLRDSDETLNYSRLRLLEAKEEDFVYKEKYENLLYQFQTYLIETMQAEPSQKYIDVVRGELQVQLEEVIAELDILKGLVKPSEEEQEQPQHQEEVAVPAPVEGKKRRGRPKKVQFTA